LVFFVGSIWSSIWVYKDSKKRDLATVDTVVWVIGCLLLWYVFLPIYLVVRKGSLIESQVAHPDSQSSHYSPATADEMARVTSLSLQPGERIVREIQPSPLVTWAFYILTLGLWEFWRQNTHYYLTDRRVIACKGVLNRSAQSIPLDRVQDAIIKNHLWVASIIVSSAGGGAGVAELLNLRTYEAREFLDDLNSRIGGALPGGLAASNAPTPAPAAPVSTSPVSVADELTKLAGLRDAGVLSDEELSAQKKKLLGTAVGVSASPPSLPPLLASTTAPAPTSALDATKPAGW
jgi:hypothetical protein